jgi:hypothetical protein
LGFGVFFVVVAVVSAILGGLELARQVLYHLSQPPAQEYIFLKQSDFCHNCSTSLRKLPLVVSQQRPAVL